MTEPCVGEAHLIERVEEMKKQMSLINTKLLFRVLLPYLATFCCVAHPNHLCRHDDLLSLLGFKSNFRRTGITHSFSSSDCAMNGQNPYPKMMSWNETADCCNWDGVTCDEITGHVIGIDLSCGLLVGGVMDWNSSLFRLSQLENLNLAFNELMPWTFPDKFQVFRRMKCLNLSGSNLYGRIPAILSHYSKLESLDLSCNTWVSITDDFENLIQNLTLLRVLSFRGNFISSSKMPMNFSSSLTYLDLSYSGVHGIIPHAIFQLPKLTTLLLPGNPDLTGVGISEINCSNPHSLQVLDLSYTGSFSGKFPTSIGCFKSLISLSFSGNGFSGSFPETVGNLTHLTTLTLSENNLQGQIPAESFSNLPKLTSLRLDSNSFTGLFPSSIANLTQLRQLDLHHNSLTAPLPSNATGLRELTYLDLSSNRLQGPIPSWLSGLPSLTELHLSHNQFTGIGGEFGCSSLELLDLADNQLHGPFPGSISTLLSLNNLDLSSNQLTGIVEQSMFSNLTQLASLNLSYNGLSWRDGGSNNITLPELVRLSMVSCYDLTDFPYSLRNFNMLAQMDLSGTRVVLWGQEKSFNISFPNLLMLSLSSCNLRKFPHFLKNLDELQILILSHNRIQGQIPWIPWLYMRMLNLEFNQLQGPLPISICNLGLFILDLSNNRFGGAIPQCFQELSTRVSVLNLNNNAIRGRIKMNFTRGCSLTNIGLNGNLLEGPLPQSLANCTGLEVLDVGNNKITDAFPIDLLGNLKGLQVLILKSNMFFGSVLDPKANHSFSNLRILDLSCNQFNGSIPAGLLKNLRAMMSSEENDTQARYMEYYSSPDYRYQYSASVVLVMKGKVTILTKILKTLATIDLSGNDFSGEIPEDIGKLISLRDWNLSHNRLTGHIPLRLANLTLLESLDLSWNRLEGEIPWQLTNLGSLEFLNLSENRLVGQIPKGNQFNTFSNDSYGGNMGLCGFPLTKSCAAPRPPWPQLPIDHEEEGSSYFFSGFTWKAVTMGYGFGSLFGLAMGSLIFLTGKPKCVARFLENEAYHIASLLFRKKRAHKRLRRPNRR